MGLLDELEQLERNGKKSEVALLLRTIIGNQQKIQNSLDMVLIILEKMNMEKSKK
jgi:hypothetical protein